MRRSKWAIEGTTENSKYYHGVLNKKRNQLAIRGILVEGRWIESPILVKDEFLSYFASRFNKPPDYLFHIRFGHSPIKIVPRTTEWFLKLRLLERQISMQFEIVGLINILDLWFYNLASIVILGLFWKCRGRGGTQEAKMMKDFRPVTLIGSLYKIIAKILANRMVVVLEDLVRCSTSFCGETAYSRWLLELKLYIVYSSCVGHIFIHASGFKVKHAQKVNSWGIYGFLRQGGSRQKRNLDAVNLQVPFTYLGSIVGCLCLGFNRGARRVLLNMESFDVVSYGIELMVKNATMVLMEIKFWLLKKKERKMGIRGRTFDSGMDKWRGDNHFPYSGIFPVIAPKDAGAEEHCNIFQIVKIYRGNYSLRYRRIDEMVFSTKVVGEFTVASVRKTCRITHYCGSLPNSLDKCRAY
ncbi:hypothetical protein Tco_0137800 [Tanacetum coccineum]